MQEHVQEKTVALTIHAAKLTARILQASIRKVLREIQQAQKHSKLYRGKQTVKQLVRQNAGVSNIEITDGNIKAFEGVARKYGVNFALKLDGSVSPPKWLVFFKGWDADAVQAAVPRIRGKDAAEGKGRRAALAAQAAPEVCGGGAEHAEQVPQQGAGAQPMMKKPSVKPAPVGKWLPYVLVFWLAVLLHEVYRLSPGTGFTKLAGLLGSPPSFAKISILPYDPGDWFAGLIAAAAFFGWLTAKHLDKKKFRKSVEYGSARWGTEKDIAPFIDPVPRKNVILTQTERLMMENRPKDPLVARNKNVVVIGCSGSGKTRFFVKPNLMQCHSSYVVTNPKGTVLVECGKLLQRRGYNIKVFNTVSFAKSMHYNPLSYIRWEKDILKLVNALIENTKGEGESNDGDFWKKAETLLYCALIGFIHYEAPPEEQNMTMLVDMINAMPAREDDKDYKNPVDMMFDILESKDPDHFAVR